MMKQITCPECDGCGYVYKSETLGCENGIVSARVWSEDCHRCNCTGLIEVPMTNAEKIRALSDEELVEMLSSRGCPPAGLANCYEMTCRACWTKWLQQPCEGGAE